ncbi:ectoine/hydroxyectoine ABC transporter ATP-binding protein EhuA [Nocardia sp. NPDC127579]|uniref:ectoine/hydroxyectoine ABC transporter ATP-binding protein EhuA n=1 Tax=Nocardia sp. NPDC127579 TaxID=3345402 RepID=UPI003640A078
MIRFNDVGKRYGDTPCLEGLDFSVAPGEFVTLIGPSGSGKTTILRLVMTLEQVSSGTIDIGGECLTHVRKGDKLIPAPEAHQRRVRRRIGMVFQQFNLFPHMTVLRNITEGPIRSLGQGREEAEVKALELLEMVGLQDKSNSKPGQLSGGQQQRVAIARALAMQPDILLLDEVTSALDPELVTGVLKLLADIAESTDLTFLCVTHEMRFARGVSDRVVVLDGGRVLEQGPPDQLFADPVEPRTREFLSAVLDREG